MAEHFESNNQSNRFFYWKWDRFFLLCYLFTFNIFGIISLFGVLIAYGKEASPNAVVVFVLPVLAAFLITNTLFYFVRKIRFKKESVWEIDLGKPSYILGGIGYFMDGGIMILVCGDLLVLRWFIKDGLLPVLLPVWVRIFG